MVKRLTKKDPYFVKFSIKTRLGEAKGTKKFKDFDSAQKFAYKVFSLQKSARLIEWGAYK